MRISDWGSDVCSSDLASDRSIDMPTLVLIRHGQSAWNLENRFTGWWDVDVTEKGAEEARAAGKLMAERGLDFDCCFTSVQTRAIQDRKSKRLNSSHYCEPRLPTSASKKKKNRTQPYNH